MSQDKKDDEPVSLDEIRPTDVFFAAAANIRPLGTVRSSNSYRELKHAMQAGKPFMTDFPFTRLGFYGKFGPHTAFLTFASDPTTVSRIGKTAHAPLALKLTSSQIRKSNRGFDPVPAASTHGVVPLEMTVTAYNNELRIPLSAQLVGESGGGERMWFTCTNASAANPKDAKYTSSVVLLPKTGSHAPLVAFVADYNRTNSAEFLQWMSVPNFDELVKDELKKYDAGNGTYEIAMPAGDKYKKQPLQWLVAARGKTIDPDARLVSGGGILVINKELMDAYIGQLHTMVDVHDHAMDIQGPMRLFLTPLNPSGWSALDAKHIDPDAARSSADSDPVVSSLTVTVKIVYLARKCEENPVLSE